MMSRKEQLNERYRKIMEKDVPTFRNIKWLIMQIDQRTTKNEVLNRLDDLRSHIRSL